MKTNRSCIGATFPFHGISLMIRQVTDYHTSFEPRTMSQGFRTVQINYSVVQFRETNFFPQQKYNSEV